MKRMIILIAAMAVVLAACGGSDDSGVASLEESTTTQAPAQGGDASGSLEEEALLEFSSCMRENGVEDFEDPVINADGTIDFGGVGGQAEGEIPSDAEIEELEAAFELCADELAGVAFGSDGAFDITELQDSFVEFAACMRDNGVELDDPDFNAPGGIIDVFGDIDITDPKIQDALEQCQDIFADFAPGGTG